ncbi:hypothetical protein LG634_24720 [Streptomyces bambusae]|uniref:hypothetical protein n=1 Tax=Streptomyces bambusae TaxID=1550616 RepID=UPI001CFCCB19|nr:hypothetical protein [Streptomyces bambusae]MCB5168017.1 hypothetical protein [Streptomyces bambusae]
MPNRLIWRAALGLIGIAAASITGWSLYVVAHDIYNVPNLLALGVALVFDGTAIAALYLAGQAVAENRSALGPHLATLGMAGVSIYLNRLHATHIDGGLGATLLFATPTVALLLITGLAWSGHRARHRAATGNVPVTLPRYGVWGWLLAGDDAWNATKRRAIEHVTGNASPETPQPHRPARTASQVLREQFATMDPADVIRVAHSAKPTAPPADLAAELVSYGVHVSPVQVALVLGATPSRITLERDDAPDAPQVSTPARLTKSDAILDAASALGPDAKAAAVVERVKRDTGLTVDAPYVRTVLSRKKNAPGVGQGGEGYN